VLEKKGQATPKCPILKEDLPKTKGHHVSSWASIYRSCLFTRALFKQEHWSIHEWKNSETERNKEQGLRPDLSPPSPGAKSWHYGSSQRHCFAPELIPAGAVLTSDFHLFSTCVGVNPPMIEGVWLSGCPHSIC